MNKSNASQSSVQTLKSRFSGPEGTLSLPLLNQTRFGPNRSPQVEHRPLSCPQSKPTYLSIKPKPPPKKPNITSVPMETKFKPPPPAGKLLGPVPPPFKPSSSVSALKGALESKASSPSHSISPRPKIPFPADVDKPFPAPPASWKKPLLGKQCELEPPTNVFKQGHAHKETGHALNLSGSSQQQKRPFLSSQSDSEMQKELPEPNSVSSIHDESNSAQPKKKPLPMKVSLGVCPAKPRRPPHVDLRQFMNHSSSCADDDDDFPPPPPPPSVMSPPPSLPQRVEQKSREETGEHTDEFEDEFDDDSYEDIEDALPSPEKLKDVRDSNKSPESKKQKKKMEKEEKEKAQREKKEKKEMEKREQEARKRFKLKGPVEVLMQVSVKLDCKGSKADLEVEKGERVDIIRMKGNPDGCWLARSSRGCYGYVKADLLDSEGNTQQPVTLDVYDDVGAPDQPNSFSKVPEPEADDDIYDCVDDGPSDAGFPPPPALPPPPAAAAADEETYDDIASSSLPSPPQIKPEMNPKKKKKFEKEEKEFRKKFKYDQEVRVLYEVTVLPVLACKKFSSKDLVIKPGDVISVITGPKDDRLICRNSEGKFGYVSVHNIQRESDIYDDVGEDCVYDND